MIMRFTFLFLLLAPLASLAQEKNCWANTVRKIRAAALRDKASEHPAAKLLEPVVVIGYINKDRCMRIGIPPVVGTKNAEKEPDLAQIRMSSRCPSGPYEEEKKIPLHTRIALKDEVKVYPNPAIAGHSVQAAMQLQKPDQYHICLVDAGGKVIWMQRLNINATNYNLTIPTLNTWSAGVYYLRITSKESGKILNGKVLLQ